MKLNQCQIFYLILQIEQCSSYDFNLFNHQNQFTGRIQIKIIYRNKIIEHQSSRGIQRIKKFQLHQERKIHQHRNHKARQLLMLLLQKPKRVVSNFSFDRLQQAKDICKSNMQEYQKKVGYGHFVDCVRKNNRPQTSYGEYRSTQTTKKISRKHTYTVQSHKYKANKLLKDSRNSQIQLQFEKERPQTAHQLRRSQSNCQTFKTVSMTDFKALFHNQQLSASLKSTQNLQNSIKNKLRSSSSACVSTNPNVHIVKTGFSEPETDEQILPNSPKQRQKKLIKQTLSAKQNFYNPYNIPQPCSYIKPIKHLRSRSIEQLKQLCQQQRNLNFNSRIRQNQSEQKQKKPKCSVQKRSLLNGKKGQGENGKFTLLSFKKPSKGTIKKTTFVWLNKNNPGFKTPNTETSSPGCLFMTQTSISNNDEN